MTILRRIGVPLTATAAMLFLTPGVGFASESATAKLYDEDTSRLIATAHFDADGDTFYVTKRSDRVGHRAYMEYRYIRKDGSVSKGTHWGTSSVDNPVSFDHNFGENRKVAFRVCVQVSWSFDPCSGDDDGKNWTVGYA